MIKGLLVCMVLVAGPLRVLAQDDVTISFSEDQDTLIKQRFIDRYENVFMTKVPTRHMFKIGLSQYYQAIAFPLRDDRILNNTSLHLGYEFKFLPAFSVALSGHIPYYDLHTPITASWQTTVIDAQLRWFVDMRKRIKEGKSANNFSGNYVAAFYNMPGTFDNDPKIGLKLGFQRRFLNQGFMDFSFAAFSDISGENLSFASQASFGFAFGDWKKSGKAPLCDIFFCDDQIRQQWKVRLPELTVGYYLNRIRAGGGFERKLGALPVSLNFQLDASMNNGFNQLKYKNADLGIERDYKQVYSREKIVSFSIQPRYYLLTKRRVRKGKSSNGLSGLYTGINTEYYYYKGEHGDLPDLNRGDSIIQTGILAGFQLRLFRHGYFDCNTSYNFKDYLKSPETSFGFRTNVALGLAF
jgi:hypothetical protein